MNAHVTIIGCGISAACAALEAATLGAHVTVIGERPGATALSSGAWDIAWDPTRYPGQPWREVSSPGEGIRQLILRSPRHPYTLLSHNKEAPDLHSLLEDSISRISRELSLHLHGSLDQTLLLPTPLGTIKATAYAGPMHSRGNILEMKEARLLVLGISGLPQFPASLVARLIKKEAARQSFPFLSNVATAEITLPPPLPPFFSPMELAMRLDQDDATEIFCDRAIAAANKAGATHVALPPVIGLHRASHIMARLSETTPIRWFETLATPPSLPGLRLHHEIAKLFENHGINWIRGEAISPRVEHRSIISLRVKTLRVKEEEVPVERVLLASGRFLSGGLGVKKGLNPTESLFGLPLCQIDRSHKLSIRVKTLFSSGVRTSPRLQPVDEGGRLALENLWVAGSVIGGYDPATQGCGTGVAVATGTLSARFALC